MVKTLSTVFISFRNMNHLRVLNVITLSALLILTGCFGLMPESEADGQTLEPEQSTLTSKLAC